MINTGTCLLSAATAQPRPPHEVGHASKPTLSMGYPISGCAERDVGVGGTGSRGQGAGSMPAAKERKNERNRTLSLRQLVPLLQASASFYFLPLSYSKRVQAFTHIFRANK